ncbi:malonyl CoA-acyl carrier protein transacylase [Alicyclobacillus cellulosilyticus]|uniref:Malonyl CoA-acyl carrier protein transacylase n=1 Tax=Alicyclobacillus cellulosilyticus TaxID=1003997 RepID=A0A917KBD8_9BACL|nr:ACP S-malonyltransferase [Alicyclobacillus cellulosilyticus]GGJ07997.1 malonyl CoA-acyl carrier protein transacylase [Alicyclobacillus cellulosilyticus]
MNAAFVFPGQGAQTVGMGASLFARYPEARALLAQADEVLGFSLSSLITNGPEEALRLTYHAQPALLTVSSAAYQVFRSRCDVTPRFVAGHSLGEYSALVAAEALSFADGVRLVHLRGRWMDEAYPAGQGAMAAVLGLDAEALAALCQEVSARGHWVEVANYNCPGQVVISGTKEGVAQAAELARQRGARRTVMLQVSGPFHSRLMRSAAEKLAAELAKVAWRRARFPVVANVDAKPYQEPEEARQRLTVQVYSPVRWEESVRAMMAAGVDTFIEFGPGGVLTGLIKKIDRAVTAWRVEDEETLSEVLRACQGR